MNKTILFSLGNLHFYSFGFFLALGVVLGGLWLWWLVKKDNVLKERKEISFFDILLYVLIAGFIGSRLGYALVYFSSIKTYGFVAVLLRGGFVLPAGLIVALAVLVYFLWRAQIKFFTLGDILVSPLFLGLAVGQVGAYLTEKGGTIPVNLYLIGAYLAVAILLYFIYRFSVDGLPFYTAILFFGLIHFITGFFSGEKTLVWQITLYQIFSLFIFLVSVYAIIYLFLKGRPKRVLISG